MSGEGWRSGRIADLVSEVSVRIDPQALADPETPYIGLEDIGQGTGTLLSIGRAGDANSQKSGFLSGDILFGKLRPNLKKVVRPDFDGVCSTDIVAFRAKSNVDPDFAFSVLSSDFVIDHAVAHAAGTKMPRAHARSVLDCETIIPPLDKQRRIAEVLRAVDEAVASVSALIRQGERTKQALLRTLLERGIGRTNFKNSSLGEIPTGWQVSRVGDFSKVIRGASPRPKGDPRYYGGSIPRLMVADVTRDGMYTTPQIDFLTEDGARLSRPVRAGTLTIVCSGTVGVPSFLAVDACIHDGFLALQNISPHVHPTYLYYLLSILRDRFEKNATHGGVFTNLTTDILKDFEVAIPTLSEQIEMSSIFAAVDKCLNTNKSKLTSINEVKRNLSASLLGEKFLKTSADCWSDQ